MGEELKAPNRIWATVNGASTRLPDGGRQLLGGWSEDPNRPRVVEYARADTIATLTAERDRLREALEKIACRHVTDKPLWWQLEARAALNASSEVLCEDEGCPHHGTPHVCVAPSETSAKPEPDVWLYRYRPIGSQYWSDWKVGTIRRDLGVKGLESEERGLYAHPPAPSETGRVSDAAQFLLDRLSEVEPSEEMARDWLGHVEPAIARLRASLNGGQQS